MGDGEGDGSKASGSGEGEAAGDAEGDHVPGSGEGEAVGDGKGISDEPKPFSFTLTVGATSTPSHPLRPPSESATSSAMAEARMPVDRTS